MCVSTRGEEKGTGGVCLQLVLLCCAAAVPLLCSLLCSYLIHLLELHADDAESRHELIKALLAEALIRLALHVALGGDRVKLARARIRLAKALLVLDDREEVRRHLANHRLELLDLLAELLGVEALELLRRKRREGIGRRRSARLALLLRLLGELLLLRTGLEGRLLGRLLILLLVRRLLRHLLLERLELRGPVLFLRRVVLGRAHIVLHLGLHLDLDSAHLGHDRLEVLVLCLHRLELLHLLLELLLALLVALHHHHGVLLELRKRESERERGERERRGWELSVAAVALLAAGAVAVHVVCLHLLEGLLLLLDLLLERIGLVLLLLDGVVELLQSALHALRLRPRLREALVDAGELLA